MEIIFHVIVKTILNSNYEYQKRTYTVQDGLDEFDAKKVAAKQFNASKMNNEISSNENIEGWYSCNYPIQDFSVIWSTNFKYEHTGYGKNFVLVRKCDLLIEKVEYVNNTIAFLEILNRYAFLSEEQRSSLYLKALERAFDNHIHQTSSNKTNIEEIAKLLAIIQNECIDNEPIIAKIKEVNSRLKVIN
jgi:hypothetical protein